MRYLVRERQGGRAHLLDKDGDTLCSMASSGGLNLLLYVIVEADAPPKPLCFMCSSRQTRLQQLAAARRSEQFL